MAIMGNRSRRFLTLGCVCLLLAGSAHFVFAQDLNSLNFRVERSILNSFGGSGTSTSFSSVVSGGETATGEATSTSFIADMGFLAFESFTPASQNWRWYNDENSETPTIALAAENTAPINIENNEIVKLRVTVKELADIGATNVKLRLQYSTSSDFSTGGYTVVEIGDCLETSAWCYDNGGGADNGVITTKVLSDADACALSVGDGCGTHNESGTTTSSFTQVQSAATEYEFTLQQSGANVNTVYFFRLVHNASSSTVPLNTGETYPSLTTGGTTLTFTIGGLSSGVSTEGITTDVTSTPTAVPFGTLSIASEIEGAQRLSVTTNASSGYKIYAYQRQSLINERNQSIDPVSGTNATPTGWSAGCDSLAAGCYGYHSGEDVLEGPSTRFTANDTFAQFTGSAEEVAYSSGPVTNKETDMVYRIFVRNIQQDGAYESSLVYIVTPVF